MMEWTPIWQTALDYDSYLNQHATDSDREKWQQSWAAAELLPSQLEQIGGFRRRMKLLCMSGAWCGDCVEHVPILRRFEQASPLIELRLLDRDADPLLRAELTICGSPRVPQTVVLNEDDQWVDRWGDRPLAKYRQMAASLEGAACSTGWILPNDPLRLEVIADWVNELLRSQLLLRTSPSLRKRYGD